jgi:hypothetical protein
MRMRREACENCAFWAPRHLDEAEGQCHRYPPASDARTGHEWPTTASADWCGEFCPAGGER